MKVKALFEFWAENESELSFQVGDVILVINRDDAGWWEGELNGQKGLFPSNYVETVPETTVSPTALPAPRAGPPPITQTAKTTTAPATGPPKWGGAATGNGNAAAGRGAGPPPITQTATAAASSGKPAIYTGNIDVVAKRADEAKSAEKSGGDRAPRAKEARTKFGLWSSNMALYSGLSMIVFGALGFVMYDQNQTAWAVNKGITLWSSIYSFFAGAGILAWERFFGQKRGPSALPARGLAYTVLSLFLFMSWPTLLPAFFLFTTAVMNFVASALGEVYDAPPKREAAPKKVTGDEEKAEGVLGAVKIYLASISQQNKIGQTVFFATYVVGNIALFANTLYIWENKVAALKNLPDGDRYDRVPSGWAPLAKACGGLLDLNCALILLPVLRSLIRYLYNRSTADQGCFATFLRGILYFIPLDQNLKFHRLIAGVIMGATIAHTVVHYINFAIRPNAVLYLFNGAWPLVSGGIVCFAMFFIYTAAFDNTKRGQFEIFWYSHHVFAFFFFFLFVHGHNGLNPGFWPYILIPGILYIVERLLRIYRANERVVVLSATVMDDVFSLEFAKEGVFASPYKEGQYIFLNSPAISAVQWHPFTISSAPEEKTVTVHIRVSVEGSWTKELCKYVSAFGPRGKSFFALDRQGPQGKLQGKILGPDGKAMLCIDGPHSAPTQHVSEYSTAVIIGAGIGATPVSATLKSVVFHRWKYFIGQCFPDHAYFMWVCAHKDIDAFRWLIRNIKDAQDEVCHMRASNPAQMASKSFEFHIWVTSVPKGQKPIDVIIGEDDEIGFWGVPREDAKVEKVRANWDEADLYKTMKCPPAHTTLQDVYVHEGRPAWSARFVDISAKHPTDNIGVTFCGNSMIASDLKKQCYLHNMNRNKGFFRLHKENF